MALSSITSQPWLSLCDLKLQSHSVTGVVRIKAWDLAAPISEVQPPVPYMLMKEADNCDREEIYSV